MGGQAVAVWLASEAVDMRKSIDGLAQAVVDSLHRQPLSGEVFVFGNRRRADRLPVVVLPVPDPDAARDVQPV
jgi:transposase